MTKDPTWFEEEADSLLEKWAEEDEGMDFPEYLEKHLSEKGKKYWIPVRNYRRQRRSLGYV